MNRLKELREQSGLSVSDLAKGSGVDHLLIDQLEEGPGQTDRDTLQKLVDTLNANLSTQKVQVTMADVDDLLAVTPSSEISKQSSKDAVARTGEISTDTERELGLAAGQAYPHTRAGYDDPRDPLPDRMATGGPASQPAESKAPSASGSANRPSEYPNSTSAQAATDSTNAATGATTDVPTVSGAAQPTASPVNEVYNATRASAKPSVPPLASADGGKPPTVSSTPTEVTTKPPTYLSYATKKEAGRAKLFARLIPALLILAVLGLVGWKVWQEFQVENEGYLVPLPDQTEVPEV